jgi:hypothetical protein
MKHFIKQLFHHKKQIMKIKKILSIIAFFLLTAATLHAQIKRAEVVKIKATPAVTTTPDPPVKDRGSVKLLPQAIGTHEAKWNSPDGTVMKQSFNLRKIMMVQAGNKGASTGGRLKTTTRSSVPESDGKGYDCITEEKRESMSDNVFMTVDYAQQASHIYPGAIYKFANYADGSWKSEENNRNPIRISASVYNTTGKNYEDIPEPAAATIGNGIATLFRGFSKNPDEIASGSMSFSAYEVESMSDAMVKIGASGYGFGFYAKNLFQFNDKEHHKYILIDCTKEMFTINTTIPKNGFFNNAAAQTADMMFINSVTYGVRILACMDIETKDRAIADKFEGGGNWGVGGGQVDVDVLSREFNSTTTIKMYVVGGRSNEVFPVYSIADLKKRCAEIARTTTYKTVMPIKYQFKNLDGEVVVSNSATDYFKVKSCSYQKPNEPEKGLEITANITSLKTLNNNTDAELYGQVWAQVFDAKGREIAPLDGKDRLFAVGQNAHLSADQLRYMYNPQISATFMIPPDRKAGAKMIIYYWLMEYDNVGSDDFLNMQNGDQLVDRHNNIKYYAKVVNLDKVPFNNYNTQTASFTAQGEGVFEVTVNVSKK